MKRNLILSTAALLALGACGNSETANDTADQAGTAATDTATETTTAVENTTAAGADSAAPAADANTATGYAMNAALSDMFEIESSRLASEKAKSPQVKEYAQMMIKEHTATTSQLKSTLQQGGITMTPPMTLDQRRQEMITELRNASADNFDTLYLDQQTAAHQEALDLHRGFAENGDNPQLKQLAGTIAPKVQQHLEMARKLDSQGSDDVGKTKQ